MGQVLGLDNIPALIKATSSTITLAATHAGKPTRVTVGGQQYVPSGTITFNTATTGFNGFDTGVLAAGTIYNIFAVVSAGSLGLVASTSSTPSGYSSYKFLGKFISSSTPDISHVMNVGDRFIEYASSTTGTWDAAATAANTKYGVSGSPVSGNLSDSRTKIVRFLQTRLATDELRLEFLGEDGFAYSPGDGVGNAGGFEVGIAIGNSAVGGASTDQYGVNFLPDDTLPGTDVKVLFRRYATRRFLSTPDFAGWGDIKSTNGLSWRVTKISDVIRGP